MDERLPTVMIDFDGERPRAVLAEILFWGLADDPDRRLQVPGYERSGFAVCGVLDGVTVDVEIVGKRTKWMANTYGDEAPVTAAHAYAVLRRFCDEVCSMTGGTYKIDDDDAVHVERSRAVTDVGDPLLEARCALATVGLDDVTYVGLRNLGPETMRGVSERLDAVAETAEPTSRPAPGT